MKIHSYDIDGLLFGVMDLSTGEIYEYVVWLDLDRKTFGYYSKNPEGRFIRDGIRRKIHTSEPLLPFMVLVDEVTLLSQGMSFDQIFSIVEHNGSIANAQTETET